MSNGEDQGRAEDGQVYVDRSKIDFDPSEGLLSGTAIDGTSEIPGSEESSLAAEQPADGSGGRAETGGSATTT